MSQIHTPKEQIHYADLPITYPAIYLQIAEERGVNQAQILAHAKLNPQLFSFSLCSIINRNVLLSFSSISMVMI